MFSTGAISTFPRLRIAQTLRENKSISKYGGFMMKGNSKKAPLLFVLLTLVMLLSLFGAASANGAQVTSGEFVTYAAGPSLGYEITGSAQLVRTADGKTLAMVQVKALLPKTTYGVHVHNGSCSNLTSGHYQNVPGGAVDAVNEIWPTVTSNANGNGSGFAMNNFTARPEAQSIVIHALPSGGPRIACADLN
jgi:Cu/Zn superoxide dismutase